MRARAAALAALLPATASCWLSSSFGGLTREADASSDTVADASDEGAAATDGPAPDVAPDDGAALDAPAPADAAACSPPTILEPTQNESVGPSIHLRASAPPCIVSIACYVDSVSTAVATSQGDSIDQWVPIATKAPHHVNCNGWDGAGAVHPSGFVDFTRTY